MKLHPCGCIFPLSQEIIEAVTSGKLEAIGGAGDAEIWGAFKGWVRHTFPEWVPEARSLPCWSLPWELTGTDISGVTQLHCTKQVSHPKGWVLVASQSPREDWVTRTRERKLSREDSKCPLVANRLGLEP